MAAFTPLKTFTENEMIEIATHCDPYSRYCELAEALGFTSLYISWLKSRKHKYGSYTYGFLEDLIINQSNNISVESLMRAAKTAKLELLYHKAPPFMEDANSWGNVLIAGVRGTKAVKEIKKFLSDNNFRVFLEDESGCLNAEKKDIWLTNTLLKVDYVLILISPDHPAKVTSTYKEPQDPRQPNFTIQIVQRYMHIRCHQPTSAHHHSLLPNENIKKFIPVLIEGACRDDMPGWMAGGKTPIFTWSRDYVDIFACLVDINLLIKRVFGDVECRENENCLHKCSHSCSFRCSQRCSHRSGSCYGSNTLLSSSCQCSIHPKKLASILTSCANICSSRCSAGHQRHRQHKSFSPFEVMWRDVVGIDGGEKEKKEKKMMTSFKLSGLFCLGKKSAGGNHNSCHNHIICQRDSNSISLNKTDQHLIVKYQLINQILTIE
ncbi:hypothetical protein HELRODRAFT_194584 [Helobdella robusta]|uniref:SEFIR domain-containing protein n=1 Tax=Helobdella robusta TaxID=6412 RepID=T1FW80_HELRO|nr:hypothetical protein HELRODRAFT_194584 [Helobdella robusta]ESN91033.1 hypothetical protein HELRODRAFT_194584 [Helobdella robusta]